MKKEEVYKNYLFAKRVERLIDKAPLNRDTLLLVQFAVNWFLNNPSSILFSEIIEKKIAQLGSKFVNLIDQLDVQNSKKLIVLTTACSSGGHTRLVENIINSSPPNSINLHITTQSEPFPASLKKIINDKECSLFISQKTDLLKKAEELRESGSNSSAIVLFTNSDDLLPLLSFGNKNWKTPVFGYNQADHIFGLNVTICDSFIDMSSFGVNISKTKRGVLNSTTIPIPLAKNAKISLNERVHLREKHNIPKEATVLFSGGSSFKYYPVDHLNFIKSATEIIEKTENCYIVVVGPSLEDANWKDASKKAKGKLIVVGILPYSEYESYYSIGDYYLDSFPISGFTTLLEASQRGLPLFFMDLGEAYPDSLAPFALSQKNFVEQIVSRIGDKNLNIVADITDHYPKSTQYFLSEMFKKHPLHNPQYGSVDSSKFTYDSFTKANSENSVNKAGHLQLNKLLDLKLSSKFKVVWLFLSILKEWKSVMVLPLNSKLYFSIFPSKKIDGF